MPRRLRTPLLVLVLLGVVAFLGWAFLGSEPADPPADAPGIARRPPTPPSATKSPKRPTPSPATARADATGPAATTPTRPGEGGSVIGSRTPSGPDYSDPAQASARLLELVAARRIDWAEVRRFVALVDGPLDDIVREAMLAAVRAPGRNPALEAIVAAKDPRLADDLLAILDDTDVAALVKTDVLAAIARLPDPEPGRLVRELEARLSNHPDGDASFLQAIAQRGGPEGARAIVEYLERSSDPTAVGARLPVTLDVAGDAAARDAVRDALRRSPSEDLTLALLRLAARPGADAMVESIAALDAGDASDRVRRATYETLAVVGTRAAVDHLLAAGAANDDLATAALQGLGRVASAEPAARDRLVAALGELDQHPQPTQARREILGALANLGHAPAAPAFAEALKDPDPGTRTVAVFGLGRSRDAGRPYVPALEETFGSADAALQRQVVLALGEIGGSEAQAAIDRIAATADLPETVRTAIQTARGQLRGRIGDE